jgi:hypothetical protein
MKVTRAISIRQPYAELILRGEKVKEFRSVPTNIRERVWIYASFRPAEDTAAWRKAGSIAGSLPTGVIVGSVEIVDCQPTRDGYAYTLRKPERSSRPRKAKNQPLPRFWRPEF